MSAAAPDAPAERVAQPGGGCAESSAMKAAA
jgi:hypothetical protein